MEAKKLGQQPINAIGPDGVFGFDYAGLTKREHFASLAMQSLLCNEAVIRLSDQLVDVVEDFHRGKWIAEQSLGFADALLAELSKEDA